jgi:hypothetical protein
MRTPQAGETITARGRVKLPDPDGRVVREGTVAAEFWAPGRDPAQDGAARDAPDRRAECQYDRKSGGWVALVDTEGWVPGSWVMRLRAHAVLEDGRSAKGYSDWVRFSLAA